MSKYQGLVLDIAKSDEKQYTLTLKDELLPKSPNGREQSTVSWEYDFKADSDGGKVYIHWDDFKPTYRGRDKKDAKPLDLKHVKRISFMVRRYNCHNFFLHGDHANSDSFFGAQEGDFSLSITSMSAFAKHDSVQNEQYSDDQKKKAISQPTTNREDQSWFGWIFGSCIVS